MIILDVKQGTPEWLSLRTHYPTASEFNNLVTPAKLKVCEGKAIDSYVAQKLAERWLGHALQSFGGGASDQGKVREEEARPWYALEYGVEIDTPGLITDDACTMACSPDGLIVGKKCGLEIKCPEADTHVGWFIAKGLPRDHLLQVQGSMLVCGFDDWEFISYHPRFPGLVVPVKRDRNVCNALTEGVGIYWEKFKAGWARLLDANGGEEPVRMYDTKFEGDAEIRTLKPEYRSPDPILEMLEA